MKPKEALSWYQRKIGAYDKQQWEQSVEQRILHGLNHVPKKTARPKTDLIDVDLVRGSAFPKAKPKHGLWTVTRLGTARFLLLPWHGEWWVKQTSRRLFLFFLLPLYVLELITTIVYCYAYFLSPYQQQEDSLFERIPPSEILVPAVMMLLLSIVHSQIVATQSNNGSSGSGTSPSSSTNLPCQPPINTNTKRVGRRGGNRRPSIRPRRPGRRSLSASACIGGSSTGRAETMVESKLDGVAQGVEVEEFRTSSETPRCRVESCDSVPKESLKSLENIELVAEMREDLPDPIPEPLVDRAGSEERNHAMGGHTRHQRRGVKEGTPLEDDGFESLNGNGSSENGEEGKEEEEEEEELGRVVKQSGPKDDEAAVEADGEEEDEEEGGEGQRGVYAGCWSGVMWSGAGQSTGLDPCTGDSDAGVGAEEDSKSNGQKQGLLSRRNGSLKSLQVHISNSAGTTSVLPSERAPPKSLRGKECPSPPGHGYYNSSCDSEVEELEEEVGTEGSTSAEWIGVTTNSEECSYSSEEAEQSEDGIAVNPLGDSLAPPMLAPSLDLNDHPFAWEFELSSTVILSPSCTPPDKVSCTVWENREAKKADLSVLDISSAIIARVESMPDNMDYFYGGLAMGGLLAILPSLYRLVVALDSGGTSSILVTSPDIPISMGSLPYFLYPFLQLFMLAYSIVFSVGNLVDAALGPTLWEHFVVIASAVGRWGVASLLVFLLAVAERTFKQRFLFAKLFSHLTSSRRARKSDLPHFRLNKVRNIKTWLSVRSYLKKRGPQRSVDVIVSAAFIMTLLLLSFLSVELLKDSVRLHSQYNLEALMWSMLLGIFLLRFMTLGTKINRKYRNLSVLITEQINLYLQIEQKPNKKEELMVANSVLKLAADLLKELESPFKISGLSANPYLYTITKVVILSALSGVLSEMLGFKLKLHKIKIK
ncbi:protein phtf isoform X2 [Ischnura elegans]|uniref:protein phtf isoform X2 n=1 Tax=Ischnura elegans TaxID=197161 RepID=UPI001ED88BFC|nr:protein phtf isoform X2 [Ischnura elegans]